MNRLDILWVNPSMEVVEGVTPFITGDIVEMAPSTATACIVYLESKNEAIHLPVLPMILASLSLCRRTPVSTLSKALLKSM